MNKAYSRVNWQNEPSISTPLNETNLNKMDSALDTIDNRVVTFDTSKANQSDLLQTVKSVTYNTETGVFVFTFWNNTTVTADLNIEKIPVSFSMDEYGVITMTTADGTTYTCDIASLIKLYTFNDSSEIDFTTTTDSSGNKTITASIINGSITGEKLQPNYLADCVSAKNGAESAESNAGQSARDASGSSLDSEAWAKGTRNGVPVSSDDPTYENNAKYYAEHGAGNSFSGLTDTNFVNLQNGQIAKYDSLSQKWINTEDEGGLLPHFKITSEAGSTVTVVCPDTSVITPTQTSSGIWQCDVPAYGVYYVHSVINGDDAVRTVTVDTVKEYVIHDEHYSYTLNVYAPQSSSILVTDGGDETYTGTGAGSTAVVFALHQASTTYTIEVTYDGLERDTTITSSATTGGSGSKTIEFGTINLTLDENLIGETIIMTNGTATKSKVADSTSMVFYPNATGNWTISCEYEGETYYSEPNPVVVSSLSTPVSAEISLIHIPEGATVTPTDDIQTWLACANITNKSYTTLAEVLADRETFETLLRDSNACDYMARSTSWAIAEGSVPTMTDNTHPSGQVIFITEYNSSFAGYMAFDKDASTRWNNNQQTANDYIGYVFTSPVCVKRVEITNFSVKTCKIQGSNDGTTWVDLSDTLTLENGAIKSTHIINNNNNYDRYCVRCLTGYGSGSLANTNFSISELQFYEANITKNPDAMALIGKYDYCSNALLGNATWAEAIANSEYWDSVLEPLVPTMTSDTTPSGVASASSLHGTSAWKAFDSDESSNSYWEAGSNTNQWIAYDFQSLKKLAKIMILPLGGTYSPKNAKIQAYINNDWVDLKSIVCTDSFTKQYFVLDTVAIAEKFRIYCIDNYGKAYVDICQLQFYGRASSNVSNTNGLIHTAMGNESVYCVETGDTFTATDGIATVDFSDFDEGTYTFGSTTAKNPNDLTEDFKKRFRITKSPYGGTTELYLLPDTIDTLYWYGYEDENLEDMNTTNGWTASGITYITPTRNTNDIYLNTSTTNQLTGVGTKNTISASSVKAIALGISYYSNMYGQLCRVATKTNNASDVMNIDTNTTKLYSHRGSISNNYAFIAGWKSSSGTASSKVNGLWYDRVSSDIPTFISASNDSLYIMDGNTKVYIANTNGEGKSYEPLLEAGTYTIYSSVAKDPNNLSNPYSKSVTITEATQTVKVMPEGAIYWYGNECDVLHGGLDFTGYRAQSSGVQTSTPFTRNANDISCTITSTNSSFNVDTLNTIEMDNYTKVYILYYKGSTSQLSEASITLTGNKYIASYVWGNSSSNWLKVIQGTQKEDIRSYGGDMINDQISFTGTVKISAFWFE